MDDRQKLIQTQQVFERANQSIRELAAAAHVTKPVRFLCECSDDDCRTELALTPAEYDRAHEGGGCFVIAPGHQTPSIERVVREAATYAVVEKHDVP